MDVKINGVTYSNIEYISIPKADNGGNATFRNVENYYNDNDFSKLVHGEITNINDVNGDISGNIRASAFRQCGELQYVNLPNVDTINYKSFGDCPKLQEINLEKCTISNGGEPFNGNQLLEKINIPKMCYIYGDYNFSSLPALRQLILGQNQVTGITNRMDYNFYGTSNNKNYVPSDLVKLYKGYTGWSSQSARFRSIKQLDKDENDYVLYYINPILSNPSGYIKNRALCTYTTSVETVQGLQTYIVGRATDTLSIVANCQGYQTKTFTVSLDSSSATTVTPDLSDMQIDSNYNGYNIVYADFCKFEQDLGVYGNSSISGTYAWSDEDVRHKGIHPKNCSCHLNTNLTLPDFSGMTHPTFVFEASVEFRTTDALGSGSVIFSHARSNGIQLSRNYININGQLIDDEVNFVGEHHFAFVLTQNAIYIYIDGQLFKYVENKNYWGGFNRTSYRLLRHWDDGDWGSCYFAGKVKQLSICLRDIADPSVAANCEFILPIPQQANP